MIFFKADGGFGVLDIWNILLRGHEIFFCSHWVFGRSVSSGLEDGLLLSRSTTNVSTQHSLFSGFYGHM